MTKENFKNKAIELRRLGKTYSEIMREIPVAKSTISLWLKEIGLSVPQKQRITEKRKAAQRRGADSQRNKRIRRQMELMDTAHSEISSISRRELWLIGIALYWAEGSKEKEHHHGSCTSFSNSDPKMISIYLKWVRECLKVPDEDIIVSLYIHESHKDRINEVLQKWEQILKRPRSFINYVYYKKNKINTNRTNIGDLYIGLLRVNIKSSSGINRKIAGWVRGICSNCGIV